MLAFKIFNLLIEVKEKWINSYLDSPYKCDNIIHGALI